MTPDYFSPNNVLVVTFGEDPENDRNAYQALTDLKQLDSQDQIKITGAAVVTVTATAASTSRATSARTRTSARRAAV